MLKYILLSIMMLCSLLTMGQKTQWADKVIEFSSELSPAQYGSVQILGEPNVPLTGGDNPNAWSPRRTDNIQYIKVGFAKPMRIQQIFIHESFNPGSVYQVFSYDEEDNEYLMATGNPRPIPLGARQTNFFFDMTQHEVVAIKVVIDGEKVPGENSIDAIGISDSNIPINVQLRIAANVNQELQTERLSDNVNSPYVEHSPLLSPDGKTLFFSRSNHPENVGGVDDYEDIWYSEWDEEKQEWKEAKNIGDRLNTRGPNFISSITPDGNNLVLLLGNRYTKNGKMRAGVSISRKDDNGEWTEPQDVEIVNDYNYSPKADYFLANSTDVMIISVERDDTFGYRDLYVCFDLGNGTWSEPLNLGSDVNTANEESAPFLADDMKTLYFSTNGYAGYGGNDIYVTKRLDDTWTRWSPPENMGAGVNSEQDDIYFNIPQVGEYGYLTKGDKEENTDIYRFVIEDLYTTDTTEEEVIASTEEPEKILVKGRIVDTKTGKPHSGDVVFERLPDGVELGRVKADPQTGEYEIELPVGARYGIRAESEGYLATNENIDLNEVPDDDQLDINLKLTPVEPDASIVINNIFFDFDKAVLRTSSYAELNRLLEFMKKREATRVRIEGHADATGPEEYNLDLSRRRALSVSDYLKENGISGSRLETEWYGETQPAAPNDNRSNRAKNRRVEFKILN